jgi:hypothetical protein
MNIKTVILLTISVLLLSTLTAENWKYSSNFNLSLTQNAYSNSWAGTELGSISWAATSNSTADKQLSDLILNKNTLKLAFGQTHSQKLDVNNKRYWNKPEKTTDKIDFESVIRFTMHGYVDPFVSGRYESQFIDFSDVSKTRILNPSQFTETAGIAKTIIGKENQTLNARLGGAFRERLNREILVDATTNKRENQIDTDAGAEFVAIYNQVYKPKDISFNSRLQLFQAFYNSKSKDLPNNDWKATDMTWENTLGMKMFKALSLSLYFELMYNKEQEKALQFKETLGLGFSFQLL